MVICKVSFGQNADACDGRRYIDKVFSSTKKTTLKYGQNLNFGLTEELFMDVFEPENDPATHRPVVIFAHGGYYIFGDKTEMNDICIEYAERGYVAATINYRKLAGNTTLDNVNSVQAIVRTMQDMKAAVRYFRHDSKVGNTFKVDTSFIFVGGYSAGAITAIHTAYWSKNDNDIGYINNIINTEGGLEGQSNNFFDVSSQVQGVINLSGAILNKNWIQSTEPPIVSFHGRSDNIVPIGTGLAGGAIGVDGSQVIHQKASQENIPNFLYAVTGGGHTDIYDGLDYNSFLDSAFTFLKEQVLCKQTTSVSSNGFVNHEAKLFPNPANNFLGVNHNGMDVLKLTLFDGVGRQAGTWMLSDNSSTIDISRLKPGVYFYLIKNNAKNGLQNGKLVIISK